MGPSTSEAGRTDIRERELWGTIEQFVKRLPASTDEHEVVEVLMCSRPCSRLWAARFFPKGSTTVALSIHELFFVSRVPQDVSRVPCRGNQ